MRLVRIVTEDGESVEFSRYRVVIRHKTEGVEIKPSPSHENVLGFHTLFFPWGVVRQIKEYDSE